MESPDALGCKQVIKSGNLSGIRVLDLSRLAPGPYCSMLLADMGAEVIAVGGGSGSLPIPAFSRGKTFIGLDLKSPAGLDAFLRLAETADVIIEGYRPGVTARLGIDYGAIRKRTPGIVYCSLTGYGQDGPLAQQAGHDINYVAMSGALGAFGPANDVPAFPLNLLADFAGGSLFAAIGILSALHARSRTGEGQYIDAAMVDGCLSMMTMHFADWGRSVLQKRGDGLVAGSAPFYRCYHCADNKYVAVGALERKFFLQLWSGLGFEESPPDHLDRSSWPQLEERFARRFASLSRDAWVEKLGNSDACLSPVLDPDEARNHPHNRTRHPGLPEEGVLTAPLTPQFPAHAGAPDLDDATHRVLTAIGLDCDSIAAARSATKPTAGLSWPPM